ncbi:uncharacterized protein LOC142165401 [Nicotiana tabacum]|uniref:Uncharacterized protein LOC142165401 n=2 Tax=Nicotiana TaxID=4085 RepID=A0AC58S510_TOBAC
MASGKFLGFFVSNRGIEVNPAHIKAIEEIPDILASKKEVQRLTGRIAALGIFISKSLEKSFKFFSVLKKQNQFEWTYECNQALKNLKAYLSNPPLLAKPKDGERLFIYLDVSEMAVSAVLVHEDKVTAYPLRNILYKQELSGRLAKWAIELSEYDIVYQPRTAIKSYVLADFVADFSPGIVPEAEKELQIFTRSNSGSWTLFTDGSSNVKGAGLGIVLIPPSGETIRQAIKCHPITNNEAEYKAVIAGLELGTYIAREARMQQYLKKARELIKQFKSWKIVQIPRQENAEAEALANLTSVAEVTNEENTTTRKKAQSLRQKTARYCLVRSNLYRNMFGGPLARCLEPSQTEYVMRKVHEGHYENYARGRSLVKTLVRARYYWPKMEEDAESFVAKCDKCQ